MRYEKDFSAILLLSLTLGLVGCADTAEPAATKSDMTIYGGCVDASNLSMDKVCGTATAVITGSENILFTENQNGDLVTAT